MARVSVVDAVFMYWLLSVDVSSVTGMDEGSKGIRHGGGGAYLRCPVFTTVHFSLRDEGSSEPVLLNVYGAPEMIPRNEFRQPM